MKSEETGELKRISKPELERKTYTIKEASQIIGVCSKLASQMVTAGKLPHIRISERKVVIPKEALEKWLIDSVQWPVKNKN